MVLLFGDDDGKDGGFSNTFSKLETMIFMGTVKVGETGVGLSFRFHQFGITPTTFGLNETEKSLEEEDASQDTPDEEPKKNPTIRYRGDFPAFYEKHKADVDALYDASIRLAFAAESAPSGEEDGETELVAEEDM